jgi:hypothetical protein
MRIWRHRTWVTVEVSDADRYRLAAIASDRNSPQEHVRRANVMLLTAAGCGTAEIMRRARVVLTQPPVPMLISAELCHWRHCQHVAEVTSRSSSGMAGTRRK